MLINQNSNSRNDGEENVCLTSPNKSLITNLQRSPSDSFSSKNEAEKSRSGKSRNKEGINI